MKKKIAGALCALFLMLGMSAPVQAQGTLPFSMTQAVDNNGHPFVGALLYFYQVGTVATRQDSFQDTALTIPNQWPLPSDAFGRIPPFYLASGSVHVRMTDQFGGPIFDYPNALVIGPSGGGGGGASVDPTTIAATGDIKFRLTGETVTGWVKMNALTIGSATSGATGRANADAQNLFVYLWTNCTNAHCPVGGGRGGSALGDFSANKTIQMPDCRGRVCMYGLDDMGNSAAGRILASNISSGGGDGVTTPMASGGSANVNLQVAMIPVLPFVGTAGTFNLNSSVVTTNTNQQARNDLGNFQAMNSSNVPGTVSVTVTPAGTVNLASGGTAATPTVSPFVLGTYYMKL
jgi:hypothetical protein